LGTTPLQLDNLSVQKPTEIIAEKKRQKLMGDESLMQTTKF
jgi:hypothetical protein